MTLIYCFILPKLLPKNFQKHENNEVFIKYTIFSNFRNPSMLNVFILLQPTDLSNLRILRTGKIITECSDYIYITIFGTSYPSRERIVNVPFTECTVDQDYFEMDLILLAPQGLRCSPYLYKIL